MDKIPTKTALKRRNISVPDSLCVFCNAAEESTEHIYTGCSVTMRVWDALISWCQIPSFFAFSVKDLLEVYNHVGLKNKEKEAFKGIVIIACWRIWRAQNALIFEGKKTNIGDIICDIRSLSFLWFKLRSKYKSICWFDWCKLSLM
ncbi:uncharacterized protein LOC143607586 [Bidens hawaiensis]|uniref:uncharacterized protein LOC143607586 n=1 Tax=Bidens hawaiensis TaxID=980011 RepID=UPI00404A1940